jgi:hypothetical protein
MVGAIARIKLIEEAKKIKYGQIIISDRNFGGRLPGRLVYKDAKLWGDSGSESL